MITEIYNYVFRKSAMLLNRNQLGSIDLSDVKLSESNIRERNASIITSFKYLKQIINDLKKAQLEFLGNQCENENQLLFGRGSTNGISLVLEELEKCKSQYEEDTKPVEEFNKTKIF